MKKTFVSLLLSLLLLLSLAACGRQPQSPDGTGSGSGTGTAPSSTPAGSFAFVLDGVTVTPGKLLDLASLPGGVDFDAARSLGVKTVHALSLPGKTAPRTAGEDIADTIISILERRGVI